MAQLANQPIGWNTASVLMVTSVNFVSRVHPGSITIRPMAVPLPFVFLVTAMDTLIFARPRQVIILYHRLQRESERINLNSKDKIIFLFVLTFWDYNLSKDAKFKSDYLLARYLSNYISLIFFEYNIS